MLAGSIALAYSIQNTHASHPCWDERRCLPWFHPLDGLECRHWNIGLPFITNRHSCAVTGSPGTGYLAMGRSLAHSRVVFTGGLQRRLSVCGLLSLMLVSLVTRPGHRVSFIIPHFALRANHLQEGGHPITASSFPTFEKISSPLSRSLRECDALTITRMRALPLGTVGKPIAMANTP